MFDNRKHVKEFANLYRNLENLSEQEIRMYTKLIRKRAVMQLAVIFGHAVLFLILACLSGFAGIPYLSVTLSLVFSCFAAVTIPICFNAAELLPFKLTNTSGATVFRWKTRQAPEWMYRSKIVKGNYCLLYGDALKQVHPERKE